MDPGDIAMIRDPIFSLHTDTSHADPLTKAKKQVRITTWGKSVYSLRTTRETERAIVLRINSGPERLSCEA